MRHTSANTTRARELLGYQPQVRLEAGLAAELEWLRVQPALALASAARGRQ